MQAFHIALEERNFKVLDLLIGLTQQMVEGEFVQMEKLGRMVGEAEYYDLIYRKTACLFDVSMRLGAVLAGASEEIEEQMGEYGRNLGIAFQIVDDVLDLTATEQVLGKPVASDLREGKATLAVVHAMEKGTAHDHAVVSRVLEDLSFKRTTHQEVLAILERHGSVQYALDCAFQYAEVARAAIAALPESDYKRALLWMPDFVVARDK
jgi:octaprenyl-diphosphate synthase